VFTELIVTEIQLDQTIVHLSHDKRHTNRKSRGARLNRGQINDDDDDNDDLIIYP